MSHGDPTLKPSDITFKAPERIWQKCPKCDAQGVVSIPPNHPANMPWSTATITNYTCDVCNGGKIIAVPTDTTYPVQGER